MPDEVVLAEALTATEYTDNITSEKLAGYTYTITPEFMGKSGRALVSSKVVVGKALETPWETYFSKDDEEILTVIDNNNDGATWSIDGDAARYGYAEKDGDDWLFSVPLNFEAGYKYHVMASFKKLNPEKPEKYV